MSKVNNSVKDSMAQLSELVAWFEGPEFKLEEAVEKFKAAEKLAGEIEKELTSIKNDITVIQKRFDSDEA